MAAFVDFGSDISGRGFCEDEAGYLAGEHLYQRKFRHWRGRSGRFYVFSAYDPRECPAYEDAVLLATNRRDGTTAALACVDLGSLPEARLSEMRRLFADRLDELEFQIHVLAERQAERASLIADIISLAA
jgi:hypothetical protein